MTDKKKLILAGIFLTALSIRIIYAITVTPEGILRGDAQKYLAIAHNLIEYGIYSDELGTPTQTSTLITPGYPLFLSLIYLVSKDVNGTYQIALFLQAILSALTCVFIYLIAEKCSSVSLAVFACFISILSPHQIITSGFLLTETLFTLLISAAIYAYICAENKAPQKSLYILAGVLFGLSQLTRPIALLIPICIVLGGFLLTRSTLKLKTQFITVLVAGAMWIPWIVFDRVQKNESVSNATSVFALGIYPDFTFRDPRLKGFPNRDDPLYPKMQQNWSFAINTLFQRVKEEPGKYLQWYLLGKPKALWQWNIVQGAGGAFIYPVQDSQYHRLSFYRFTYTALYYLHPFIIALGTLGLLLAVSKVIIKRATTEDQAVSVIALVCGYVTFSHMVFASLPRFSIPFHPLMYIGAMYLLFQINEYRKSCKPKRYA